MKIPLSLIKEITDRFPAVTPFLQKRARWIYHSLSASSDKKTYDYMLAQITGLVRGVYNNQVYNFIDIMANLISGQLTQAYNQAWEDEGFTDLILPQYLSLSLEEMILNQYSFVDRYYSDIVNARELKKPIEPLLARAELWANQWNSAYNEAVRLINVENGGKLIWREGDTVEKCETCLALDGIVMFASEWEALGVHPQGFPNEKLDCKGGHCDCSLESTTARRTRNGYSKVQSIIGS